MEASFWLEKWQEPKHGWMQEQINSRLVNFWSALNLPPASPVIVPLCGESVDIDWLVAKGHSVCGCELSERALQDWFQRHDLAFDSEVLDSDNGIKRLTAHQQERYVQLADQTRGAGVIEKGVKQLPPHKDVEDSVEARLSRPFSITRWSNSATLAPLSAQASAVVRPTKPAPIIRQSNSVFMPYT